MRTDRLRREYDVVLVHTMFPLHPDTPDAGRSLVDLFGGREEYVTAMRQRLVGLMQHEGLPYGDRTHTYNSRRAQELAKWAETRPESGAAGIHDALYRAYFVDGANLAEVDVLKDVASALGLPAGDAEEAVTSGQWAAAVDGDWDRSRHLGVTGVPTFVVGNAGVVGAQPYEVLERLVVEAGGRKKEPT